MARDRILFYRNGATSFHFHRTAQTPYKVINIIRFKKIRVEKHELLTLTILIVPRPINRTTSKTLLVVAFTVEFIACDVVSSGHSLVRSQMVVEIVVLFCSIDDGNCIAGLYIDVVTTGIAFWFRSVADCNVVFPADKQFFWAITHSVFFFMHFRKSFLSLVACKTSIQDLYCLKQTFFK